LGRLLGVDGDPVGERDRQVDAVVEAALDRECRVRGDGPLLKVLLDLLELVGRVFPNGLRAIHVAKRGRELHPALLFREAFYPILPSSNRNLMSYIDTRSRASIWAFASPLRSRTSAPPDRPLARVRQGAGAGAVWGSKIIKASAARLCRAERGGPGGRERRRAAPRKTKKPDGASSSTESGAARGTWPPCGGQSRCSGP